MQDAIAKGVTSSNQIFAEAWTKGGYSVVTEPGPDVLQIKTGVVNIWVNAPEPTVDAPTRLPGSRPGDLLCRGQGLPTGALLGRAVDQRFAGEGGQLAHSVSNREDFRELVENWAKNSVRGIDD